MAQQQNINTKFESFKGETRINLGENMFLTYSEYQGASKIHLRKFTPCFKGTPGKFYPTKYGTTMTPGQFISLTELLPAIIPDLLADRPTQDMTPTKLGGDLYFNLKFNEDTTTTEVHIRKFFTNHNGELVPSPFGVTLSFQQTMCLYYSMSDVVKLCSNLNKEEKDSTCVRQVRSDFDLPQDLKDMTDIIADWSDQDFTSEATPGTSKPRETVLPPTKKQKSRKRDLPQDLKDMTDIIAEWSDQDFASEATPGTSKTREEVPPPAKKQKSRKRLKLSI